MRGIQNRLRQLTLLLGLTSYLHLCKNKYKLVQRLWRLWRSSTSKRTKLTRLRWASPWVGRVSLFQVLWVLQLHKCGLRSFWIRVKEPLVTGPTVPGQCICSTFYDLKIRTTVLGNLRFYGSHIHYSRQFYSSEEETGN